MHRFQHGIRLAFLRPVGACFGFLLQQETDHDDDGALLPKLKGEEERQLPPVQSGEEEEDAGEGLLRPSLGEEDAVNTDLQQPEDGDLLPRSGEDEAEYNLQPVIKGHNEEEGTILPLITRGDYQKLAEDDDLQMQQPHVGHNKTKQEADEEDLHANNKGSDPWLMALHTNCLFNEAIDKQRDSNSPATTAINLQILIFTNVQEPGQKFGEAYSWEMPTHTPRPRVKMKIGIRVDHMDAHSWEHDGWASSNPTLHHQKLMHATTNEVLDNTSLSFSLHILRGSVHQQDDVKKDEVKIHGAAALKAKTKRRTTPMRLYHLNKDLLDPG